MMTAEQLKNSILQLALQGRLVDQNPADESAQKLLERIRAEKKTMIKAGTIPNDKKMEDVSEDEQLFDVPENWIWTRMGELFQHNTGKALNGTNKDGEVLTYITTSNLYWNRFELDNLKSMPFTESEVDKCTVTKGDLLVCEGGDYGRAAIWNYDFDIRIQNHVHRLRAYLPLCTEYFYYVINFLKGTGLIKGKGIAIQGLSSGALHNLVVPLPPLEEQKRIVAKIEELVPFVEQYAKASTRLNTLNASFPDQMKKSILQQAVMGKLVPQDPNDEPASVLLKKIREVLPKHKSCKDDLNFDSMNFDIPETWEWAELNELFDFVDYRGKTPHKIEQGVFLITASNIRQGFMEYTRKEYISEEEYLDRQSRGITHKGDLLVTTEAPMGNAAICDLDRCSCGQRIITLQPFCEQTLVPELYMYFILSPAFQMELLANCTGTTAKGIKADKLKHFKIPLPPYEEQMRIVQKLQEVIPATNILYAK